MRRKSLIVRVFAGERREREGGRAAQARPMTRDRIDIPILIYTGQACSANDLLFTSSRSVSNSDSSFPRFSFNAHLPAATATSAFFIAAAALSSAVFFSSSKATRAAFGTFSRLSCNLLLVSRRATRAAERAASALARAARSAAAPVCAASISRLHPYTPFCIFSDIAY